MKVKGSGGEGWRLPVLSCIGYQKYAQPQGVWFYELFMSQKGIRF